VRQLDKTKQVKEGQAEVAAFMTTICTLTLFAVTLRQSIRLPRGHVWWFLGGVGFLDTCIIFVGIALVKL